MKKVNKNKLKINRIILTLLILIFIICVCIKFSMSLIENYIITDGLGYSIISSNNNYSKTESEFKYKVIKEDSNENYEGSGQRKVENQDRIFYNFYYY